MKAKKRYNAPRKNYDARHQSVCYSDKDFLTVGEVASLMRVHEQTVYGWIADERLECVRLGRTIRIPVGAVYASTILNPSRRKVRAKTIQ